VNFAGGGPDASNQALPLRAEASNRQLACAPRLGARLRRVGVRRLRERRLRTLHRERGRAPRSVVGTVLQRGAAAPRVCPALFSQDAHGMLQRRAVGPPQLLLLRRELPLCLDVHRVPLRDRRLAH